MRVVLRFVASVAMVSGVLLVLDAGLTLVWQEPVSAATAGGRQAQLDDELQRLEQDSGTRGPTGRAAAASASRAGRRAGEGSALGRLRFPSLRTRPLVIVQGTDTSALRSGPGHYPDTPLPGERGTVAIAGHRTTYGAPFRSLDRLRTGDPIVIDMPYGRFAYRVEGQKIVPPTALEVTRRVGYDRLVLTACHPLYSAAQRIVVFARLVKPGNRAGASSTRRARSPRSR